MPDNGVSDLLRRSGDHIHNPVRQARLLQNFNQGGGAEWGERSGFEDDRVPADKGGAQLSAGNGDRKIPGGDAANNPDRLA